MKKKQKEKAKSRRRFIDWCSDFGHWILNLIESLNPKTELDQGDWPEEAQIYLNQEPWTFAGVSDFDIIECESAKERLKIGALKVKEAVNASMITSQEAAQALKDFLRKAGDQDHGLL